ncbi:MAG: demethoxyubiquinone hydroxylase family protein [Chloroflexota bacterium]
MFIRINHWLHTLAMLVIIPTGLYIHYPSLAFLVPSMAAAHVLKETAVIVLVLTWVTRVGYYLYTGQWRDVLFLPGDVLKLPSLIAYYLFIRPTHPYYGKYNPGQKLMYTLWDLLMIPMGLTGILLDQPGLMASLWFLPAYVKITKVRLLHYYLSLFYTFTTALHIYLTVTENPEVLRSMFTGYARTRPGASGTGRDGSVPHDRPFDRPAVLRALNEFLALERQQVAMYGAQAAMVHDGALKTGLIRLQEVEQGHIDNITALIEENGGRPGLLPALAPGFGRVMARVTRASGIVNLLKLDAAIERKATNDYQTFLDRVSDERLRYVMRSNQVDEEQHIFWLDHAIDALHRGDPPEMPRRRKARAADYGRQAD